MYQQVLEGYTEVIGLKHHTSRSSDQSRYSLDLLDQHGEPEVGS
jgi:hypothetical protein